LFPNTIAPGTNGKFEICIENIEDKREMYYFSYYENTYKPENLTFEVDGNKFGDLKEVINYMNSYINNKTTIYWEWKYYGDDEIDTLNGEKSGNYAFYISLMRR
jgi:hypothetical protein